MKKTEVIVFRNNGPSRSSCKIQTCRASKERNLLYLIISTYTEYFKLFDTMITPVLIYGSDIWGTDYTDIIEYVHLQ